MLAGREAHHAAHRAGLMLAALRDGNGWKSLEVKTATGETAPYIAPHKSPKTVKTQIAGKRLVQELRKQRP